MNFYHKGIGEVKTIWKNFKRENSFTRNLGISFSGNALATILGFIFTPFIARLYGPSAYGLFALFLALTSLFQPILTLQFHMGYVVIHDDSEFRKVLKLSFLILLISTSVISGLLITQSQLDIIRIDSLGKLKPYTWLFPIYFILMGFENILLGWNIKLKEFKRGAYSKILSILISKGATVILGILLPVSAIGLLVGNLVVYVISVLTKISSSVKKSINQFFIRDSLAELLTTFKKFEAYPLYVMPGSLFSIVGAQLPVYFFAFFYDSGIIGQYALAKSVIVLPLGIIVGSTTQVFLQRASELSSESPEKLQAMVQVIYKRLFLLSIFPLFGFSFIGEFLFNILFGYEWRLSGLFAVIIAICSVFTLAMNPISVVFRILNKEKINFMINLLSLIVKLLALVVGVIGGRVEYSLIAYCIATFLSESATLVFAFKILNLNSNIIIRDSMVVLFFIILVVLFKI
jgi:O-antigen/teichoic acid export membrane protein